MSKVLFLDLDGVCFDVTERFNRARKPDGKIDFKIALDPALVVLDVPIDGVAEAIRAFMQRGFEIVLLTGRPERMREATVARLVEHDMQHHELIMRKDGDYRKSPVVKTLEVLRYLIAHIYTAELIVVDDQVENHEAIAAMMDGMKIQGYFYENVRHALFCTEKREP